MNWNRNGPKKIYTSALFEVERGCAINRSHQSSNGDAAQVYFYSALP